MITTVTLNPAIDREYIVGEVGMGINHFIYTEDKIRVTPGGKGLVSAIDLKNLGYHDVQNIGFVGGKQGLFFEKLVQKFEITTNYIYTDCEIRNNFFIVGENPVTYTHYNDYTYKVDEQDIKELIKRFKRGIVDSEYIMISGSIPGGVKFDIYKELIGICHENNKKVYLHGSGEVMERALSEKPLVVVPYFKHSRKIMGQPMDTFEDYLRAGKELKKRGAQYVILPYRENRLVFTEGNIYLLSPESLNLKNWHGAGEAYNAAFFDYIHNHGFEILEASKYAAAAALAVAEKLDIFLRSRDEIYARIDKIRVEKVGV